MMAEGWRQILEDMRAALTGKAPQPKTEDAGEDYFAEAAVDGDEAAVAPAPMITEALPEITLEETTTVSTDSTTALTVAEAFPETAEPDTPLPEIAPDEIAAISADVEPAEIITDPARLLTAGDITAAEPALEDKIEAPSPRDWRRYGYALAVLGLLAAAFWIFGGNTLLARLTAPQAPASDVIATFDGGQITIADLEAHLTQLLGEEFFDTGHPPEEILAVVEDLVMDRLVSRWAAERQPDSDETFRHTIQHINESLNLQSFEGQLHEGDIPVAESEIQAYYEENRESFGDQPLTAVREQIRQTLVAAQEQDYVTNTIEQLKENASVTRSFELLEYPAPTEDELRLYYEENREQFNLPSRVVVDELRFPIGEDEAAARQAADDALLKLRSGADFAAIPEEVPSAQVSSEVPVNEDEREAEWDAAVFQLTNGELSDVFRAGGDFYVVQLQEKEEARLQTFEEVRDQIEAAVAPQVRDEWFTANANKTLFTLKSNRYTVGEFYREYQELSPTLQAQFMGPEGMKDLAEQLIERLLIVEDANERLLDVENQALLDEARLQVLKQMLHQEEVDDKIEITDEEIQQFYDENQELMAYPPQARIRYVRIGLGNNEEEEEEARQRADEAYRRLVPGLFQQGEDFAVIAQEYSEDPDTAANGGEFPDWIGESDDLLAEMEAHSFHEAIINLDVGEISEPFEFGGSLYIVEVIERSEPETVGLEDARPFIEEILTQQRHEERQAELQNTLLEQANFEIYAPVLQAYLQQLPTPEPFIFPFETPAPYPYPSS